MADQDKRLMLVIRDLGLGGAERVFVRFANYCASKGIETHLVCLTGSGPLASSLHAEVSLHVLGARSIRSSTYGFVKLLRTVEPDAVMSTLPQVNILVVVACRLFHHRSRVFVREANDPRMEHPYKVGAKQFVQRFTGLLYQLADKVLAVSPGVAEALDQVLHIPKRKIITLPNMSLDDSIQALAVEAIPEEFNERFNEFDELIACIARYSAQKDHHTLLNAFVEIRKQRNVGLILIGNGSLELELRSRARELGIQDSVFFITNESNPYRWLAASSVSVLSSKWEGSPNVIVESLSLGVPVVSTDCPSGPREILADGRWGYLVPVGDAASLAAATLTALEAEIEPNRLRERANDFHVETVGPQLLAVMDLE